jgi:hypothetical protein
MKGNVDTSPGGSRVQRECIELQGGLEAVLQWPRVPVFMSEMLNSNTSLEIYQGRNWRSVASDA